MILVIIELVSASTHGWWWISCSFFFSKFLMLLLNLISNSLLVSEFFESFFFFLNVFFLLLFVYLFLEFYLHGSPLLFFLHRHDLFFISAPKYAALLLKFYIKTALKYFASSHDAWKVILCLKGRIRNRLCLLIRWSIFVHWIIPCLLFYRRLGIRLSWMHLRLRIISLVRLLWIRGLRGLLLISSLVRILLKGSLVLIIGLVWLGLIHLLLGHTVLLLANCEIIKILSILWSSPNPSNLLLFFSLLPCCNLSLKLISEPFLLYLFVWRRLIVETDLCWLWIATNYTVLVVPMTLSGLLDPECLSLLLYWRLLCI